MADLRVTPAGANLATVAPVRFPELRPATEEFGATLGRAVSDVNSLQLKAQEAAVQLAAGQAGDTAETLATIEKASISFQFALQIRNKLLEAYQDVMRMPL
jgi:flagellar hook-basal body complex protein FliE